MESRIQAERNEYTVRSLEAIVMATLRPGPNRHLAPKLDVFTTTATLSTTLLVADSQLRVNEWMRRLNHGRKYGGPRNPEPRRYGRRWSRTFPGYWGGLERPGAILSYYCVVQAIVYYNSYVQHCFAIHSGRKLAGRQQHNHRFTATIQVNLR